MNATEQDTYCLWISWEEQVASFRPQEGFDCLPFYSNDSYQTNIRILEQSGFRFR